MRLGRRVLLSAMASLLALGSSRHIIFAKRKLPMYGLIGKMMAVPGSRDALIEILVQGTLKMPGCVSYIVAKDTTDRAAIWITEVWADEASHKASLALPAVRAAIAKGRPLIASFADHIVTEPVGGHGLG